MNTRQRYAADDYDEDPPAKTYAFYCERRVPKECGNEYESTNEDGRPHGLCDRCLWQAWVKSLADNIGEEAVAADAAATLQDMSPARSIGRMLAKGHRVDAAEKRQIAALLRIAAELDPEDHGDAAHEVPTGWSP